ncbi:MAG: NADH-quinone oxidoreductase subunit NuoH [Desulfurococcales archaeon]|nr:NADH-quinone oxidoreductase subunit NuoH [Desulfurococcales archaeon]
MSVVDLIISIIFYPPLFQLLIVGLGVSLLIVMFIIWFERKATARVQRRLGPYYIAPRMAGMPQLVADLVRYAFQEVIIPRTVDRDMFLIAPIVGTIMAVVPILAMPLTSNPAYWPMPMDYSMIVAAALLTVSPIFLILAGWASNNKFAVIGGIREAFVITVYELIAILAFLSASAATLSFNLVDIVQAQSGFKWFIILNPLAFLAMFLAVLMATSGFPFEIPESENEVVAGPFTEYSGLMYGLNMGAAYIKRFVFSVGMALVFLGGWLPYTPGKGVLAGYLIPALIVLVKATILMMAFSFTRSVYGRFRLDQALDGAWRLVFPLAVAGFGLALLEAYIGII